MKIILTGGGTAGHVTPNLAVLPGLLAAGHDVEYIGAREGIERDLIEKTGIAYHGISAGKLRRYLSVKNISDTFRVVRGLGEANRLIRKIRPDVVFSKGGFVTVPVCIAAGMRRIPVIIHESDITIGLANKIAAPFAKKICAVFPETFAAMPPKKAVLAATPIRAELFSGNRFEGIRVCGFTDDKPVLLIMGGSQGSIGINSIIRQNLDALLKIYNIAHICGAANIDEAAKRPGYAQFGYISSELPHILAAADLVISRAGSNSINEFLALRIPALLIPLGRKASRGDQILNAQSFAKRGYAAILDEDDLTPQTLLNSLTDLYANRGKYIANMEKSGNTNGIDAILSLISQFA